MHPQIRIEKNIVFGQTDKENLTADVYLPLHGEDFPIVLLIHGGAWRSGSKEMYQEWGSFLAEQGFAAVAINYRLATPSYSTWPGALDDIRMAVNWLVSKASEWKLEPQKLGLIGDSAGAHLAALFALVSKGASFNVRAVVNVYGRYDLEKSSQHAQRVPSDDRIERFIGTTIEKAPEEYRKASPIKRIEGAASNPSFDTRFFLIWGGY